MAQWHAGGPDEPASPLRAHLLPRAVLPSNSCRTQGQKITKPNIIVRLKSSDGCLVLRESRRFILLLLSSEILQLVQNLLLTFRQKTVETPRRVILPRGTRHALQLLYEKKMLGQK